MSLYGALGNARMVPGLGKAVEKIGRFTAQIEGFRSMAQSEEYSIKELIEAILEETGYEEELQSEGEIEAETRMENIEELISKAAAYEEDAQYPSLDEFLEQVALVADIDNVDSSEDRVTLMTLHSAKGLEFPKVYLAGMEDGLFPGMMAISSDDRTDMEEERRLCYVGITRAKKELVITAARKRMIHGETRYCKVSRFVEEIPAGLLREERLEPALGNETGGTFGNTYFTGGYSVSGMKPGSDEEGLPWNQPGSGTVSTFGKGYNAYASKTANFGSGAKVPAAAA